MTLISSLLSDAFRESNIIPLGRDPSEAQRTEALRLLTNSFKSIFGNTIGFVLNDWTVQDATHILDPTGFPRNASGTGFTVKPQSRLVCGLDAATTLELDPQPQDGQRLAVLDAEGNFAANSLTLDANGRLIEGAPTLVLSTNSIAAAWFYRADTANWTRVPDALDPADDWPLPEEFDDYFTITLAARLNPRYGRQLDDGSKARLDQQSAQLAARYSQTRLRQATGLQSAQAGMKGA